MSSSLLSLPVELLHEIVALVEHASTLASLCLTSRDWYAAASKPLDRVKIELDFHLPDYVDDEESSDSEKEDEDEEAPFSGKPSQLSRTLLSRPDLASLATRVTITASASGVDAAQEEASFEVAKRIVRTILEVSSNIAFLKINMTDNLDGLNFLKGLDQSSAALQRLQRLEIAQSCEHWSRASVGKLDLPSLTYLKVNVEEGLSLLSSLRVPTLALTTLHMYALDEWDLDNRASSPSRLSLTSVFFTPCWTALLDWSSFPNLKAIRIGVMGDQTDETAFALKTCLAAEEVAIFSSWNMPKLYSHLQKYDTLHAMPPSVVVLDLTDTMQLPNGYFLDWLCHNETQCPALRKIRLCKPTNAPDKKESGLEAFVR